MDKVTLSNSTFEALVKHLVEMEEGKNKIVDQYFPDPSPEREEFKELIEQYINLIESLVANARKSKKQDRAVPFVTIGCEVELEDLATGETLNYRIASPLHGTVREGDVSCLSPWASRCCCARWATILRWTPREAYLNTALSRFSCKMSWNSEKTALSRAVKFSLLHLSKLKYFKSLLPFRRRLFRRCRCPR